MKHGYLYSRTSEFHVKGTVGVQVPFIKQIFIECITLTLDKSPWLALWNKQIELKIQASKNVDNLNVHATDMDK